MGRGSSAALDQLLIPPAAGRGRGSTQADILLQQLAASGLAPVAAFTGPSRLCRGDRCSSPCGHSILYNLCILVACLG